MNIPKRMMIALLALLPLATGTAFADTEHGYSRIYIFGASFMDSGNHFAVTGETAHPPFELITFANYGIGGHRPTNGPTWVEVLAREMDLTEWAKPAYRDPAFGNYAYAYGRAREVAYPWGKSLGTQVQDWIANGYCTQEPMNDTLFIVDAGYADLLDIMAVMAQPVPDMQAAMDILEGMTASIANNIGILYGCGARNVLFAYLLPAEAAPISSSMPSPADSSPVSLTAIYNYGYLKPFVIDQLPDDMNVYTVDFFEIVAEVLTMPEAFGLTNVTDACVKPYVLKDAFCKDRAEHFWWDQLHPTKQVHALFAESALASLSVSD